MNKIVMLCVSLSLLLSACAVIATQPDQNAEIPNPASVYCTDNGGTLEIRTAEDGGQSGVCLFPDGSECEEWAYFRGECVPGD